MYLQLRVTVILQTIASTSNTLSLWHIGWHFGEIFKCFFRNKNNWISNNISLKYILCCLTDNFMALYNGLVPNRRQAIIWSNHYPVHWRIYASSGLTKFRENILLYEYKDKKATTAFSAKLWAYLRSWFNLFYTVHSFSCSFDDVYLCGYLVPAGGVRWERIQGMNMSDTLGPKYDHQDSVLSKGQNYELFSPPVIDTRRLYKDHRSLRSSHQLFLLTLSAKQLHMHKIYFGKILIFP